MKFGPVEGSSEDIKDFLKDNGLDVEKYFQEPEKPIHTVWFAIPAALVFISIGILTLAPIETRGISTFVFLFGCAAALWLAANIQLRFKNIWAAGGVLVGLILFLLVALGVILPADLPTEARRWAK